ncbi:MAG: hypothetical protein LBR66_04950 [Candidatus Symbiothrix sp.]|jgi:hypothetical protein|nr:hypothetical protein [Candidatus Symbiothrix sp.]
MKTKIVILVALLCLTSRSLAVVPSDSIKQNMLLFLTKVDHIKFSMEYISDIMIADRKKQEKIEEVKEGVFRFSSSLSSGFRYHFLLVDKDSFQILNMTEPIDINVSKLVHFFERNEQYSRGDILFYINDLIVTYRRNEEYMESFNGFIR